LCVSQLMHDLCRNLLILHRQPSASQPGPSCQSTWTAASQPGPSCQSTSSSASQPGRQPVTLDPAASQPGLLPVNLDGSQSTWPQLPVSLVICLSTWTAASHPDQQPVNLASSQSTWPGASSAIRTEHGRPPVMSTEVSTVKSGDIHYWSVDHHRYNICTLTSVITKKNFL
jgi:hypothetical protein